LLRELTLKAVYRTETDNLLEDFYIPVLRNSKRYDRAVGYFSASMLSIAAQGLSAFVEADGKMRLIFGGELLEEEASAISSGYDLRKLALRESEKIIGAVDNIADALCYRRLEALSWLVATGSLDIKVALRPRGMYHEKIGILTDEVGDRVVFQGSANETTAAMLPDFNFESINVFPSWRPELSDHSQPYIDGFERLWTNTAKNALVISFPEAARERLIKISKHARMPSVAVELKLGTQSSSEEPLTSSLPGLPKVIGDTEFALRKHQHDALNAWRSHGLQGILALATGAGKTITALYGAVRLFEATGRMFLVIAVPYQNLADQWVREAAQFGMRAVRCYGGHITWAEELNKIIHLFQTHAIDFGCVVVVERTLSSNEFRNALANVSAESLMFVGDECHHHRSEAVSKALPENAKVRLGLSATPEPYRGGDESDLLTAYYGPVVARYDLADALADEVLSPYEYYVHPVDLTEPETEEYKELSRQISVTAASSHGDEKDSNGRLDMLLFRRSRLLGNAANKLERLTELVGGKPPQPLTLFYCGDGSTEDEVTGENIRQVEAVSRVLYEAGWKVSHFTARESRRMREQILANFRLGIIDAMVAIRCLDEGIDVPACRTAFILASSRNPRQFVQRRGRILRRSPGKMRAVIHDMLVTLPSEFTDASMLEANLMRAELRRVSEFARLAVNGSDAYRTLEPLLKRYDLVHHFV